MENKHIPERNGLEIAVIGMAGKFPGAKNIKQYRENIMNGVESITFFSDEELRQSGVDPELIYNPNYVKANGILEEREYFDSSFFNYTALEAEVMDPQARVLHECVWEALENAGYNPGIYKGLIGLYVGASSSTFWETYSYLSGEYTKLGSFSSTFLASRDFISTNISYRLNLKGPSLVIQSACSTSLTAIHVASRALLTGECDIALAGGVTVGFGKRNGYLYEDGMVYSHDGHCRAFDADATGTIPGDGVGIVVLKPLEKALDDRNFIYAVVKGSAINNDGRNKVGYTAPSVDGQADVIKAALAVAEVPPESIGYIETHGTATSLGDLVEFEALKMVYKSSKNKSCAIGSVKTNVGHLDCAAGVTGFIKAVLALYDKKFPPSLHFKKPNPKIDFDNSPFFVNTELRNWEADFYPRRAGVSSFGIGGSNAHVILEEAPNCEEEKECFDYNLILLSARSKKALETTMQNIIDLLKENTQYNLSDIAYTLQVGRKTFEHRQFTVASNCSEAIGNLANADLGNTYYLVSKEHERPIVFMFPGQGVQYINLGRELYQSVKEFRDEIDSCFDILKRINKGYIKEILYPNDSIQNDEKIQQIDVAPVVTFIIEYALAKYLIKSGLEPQCMVGHSIGEFTAACLANVFTLEDALKLVSYRGELMKTLPTGIMLSVPLRKKELQEIIGARSIAIAADHGTTCIASGIEDVIKEFENELRNKRLICQRLSITHAGHSYMMDSIINEFEKKVNTTKFNMPQIPFISTLTGTWVQGDEIISPSYWSNHAKSTVQFADGIKQIMADIKEPIFLEVGPGNALSRIVMQVVDSDKKPTVLNLMKFDGQDVSDVKYILNRVGQIWLHGGKIDWEKYHLNKNGMRIPLPTYPFERKYFKFEGSIEKLLHKDEEEHKQEKKQDISDWFYLPTWKTTMPQRGDERKGTLAFFYDDSHLSDSLLNRAADNGCSVVKVKQGVSFTQYSPVEYEINPSNASDYLQLIQCLKSANALPDKFIFLWGIEDDENSIDIDLLKKAQELGFYSLIYMADALGKNDFEGNKHIVYITNNMQKVGGEHLAHPEMATILGPIRIIPKEYPNILCSNIDISFSPLKEWEKQRVTAQLYEEILANSNERIICYRGNQRLVQAFEPIRLEEPEDISSLLKGNGVYLFTGGLGGIGLTLCEYITDSVKNAKLILIQRRAFPARIDWDGWVLRQGKGDETSRRIMKLKTIEQTGASIEIYSADISDENKMREIFDEIYLKYHRIYGVIHCGGISDGGLIHNTNKSKVDEMFAAKLYGTVIIDKLMRKSQPDFYVLCSSFNSVLSTIGTTAYTAANSFLDAYALYKSSVDSIPTISINWFAWQETGGAVENIKKLMQGVKRQKADESGKCPFVKEHVKDNGQDIFVSALSVKHNWLLDEHRVKGTAVLPGTGYIDIVSSIMNVYFNLTVFEIYDVYFIQPLYVGDTEDIVLHTIIKKEGGNGCDFTIKSRSNGSEWKTNVIGKVKLSQLEQPKYDITQFNLLIQENDNSGEGIRSKNSLKEKYVQFGSRWRDNIKNIVIDSDKGIIFLELPDSFETDLDNHYLHPALFDVALATQTEDGTFYLPFYYKRIKIFGRLPKKIISLSWRVYGNKKEKGLQSYNYTIFDEQGKVIVDIEEYSLVDNTKYMQASDSYKPDAPFIPTDNIIADSAISEALKNGITPKEGVEVFKRILYTGLSQVIVCPIDIQLQLNRDRELDDASKYFIANENAAVSLNERPELSTPYVVPKSEIEEKLASTWQGILGLDKVGIHDSFFDLGATSITIIQVNRKIQKEFNKNISVVNYYLYPTVHEFSKFLSPPAATESIGDESARTVESKSSNKLKIRKSKVEKA